MLYEIEQTGPDNWNITVVDGKRMWAFDIRQGKDGAYHFADSPNVKYMTLGQCLDSVMGVEL